MSRYFFNKKKPKLNYLTLALATLISAQSYSYTDQEGQDKIKADWDNVKDTPQWYKKLPLKSHDLLEAIQAVGVSQKHVDTFICVMDKQALEVDHPTFSSNKKLKIAAVKLQKHDEAKEVEFIGAYLRQQLVGRANGHGTGMAGLIAGQSESEHFAGILSEAKLRLRYVDVGDRHPAEAIQDCVDEQGRYPQVISTSMTWSEKDLAQPLKNLSRFNFEQEVQKFIDQGTLVVSSFSLNTSQSDFGAEIYKKHYPSSLENVLSVGGAGSIKSLDAPIFYLTYRYDWSHDKVDVVAPGYEIYRPSLGGSYIKDTGASPATAIVAGAAALVWSYAPECSAAQVRQALKDSARALGPSENESFYGTGYGLIQVRAAIENLQKQCPSRDNPALHAFAEQAIHQSLAVEEATDKPAILEQNIHQPLVSRDTVQSGHQDELRGIQDSVTLRLVAPVLSTPSLQVKPKKYRTLFKKSVGDLVAGDYWVVKGNADQRHVFDFKVPQGMKQAKFELSAFSEKDEVNAYIIGADMKNKKHRHALRQFKKANFTSKAKNTKLRLQFSEDSKRARVIVYSSETYRNLKLKVVETQYVETYR